MNFQDYNEAARRTEAPMTEEVEARMVMAGRELHHVFGIVTEAGELMDAYKKHIFYGKRVDETNILEEIGDLMWYVSGLIDSLCHDRSEVGDCFDQIIETNIAKLRARFPDKFTEERAVNRDLITEREILEGN